MSSKILTLNSIVLFCVLVVSVIALVYSIKNKTEINDIEKSLNKGPKAGFTSRDNLNDLNTLKGSPDDRNNPFFGAFVESNSVKDGNDASNYLYPGSAQSQCPPSVISEAAHSHSSFSSGAPKMVSSAAAHTSLYADESSSNSLASRTLYSCAPDSTGNPGGCDYSINPSSLMPNSWREGVKCNDSVDPQSQWAKFHPSREKYYRYITAAGSARLGINTRNPLRKVLGVQNFLRSATSVPLSTSTVAIFGDSSSRQQAIFDSVGEWPTGSHC